MGVEEVKPYLAASASRTARVIDGPVPLARAHGAIAPPSMDRRRFGITRLGSISSLAPRPSHSSQAPCGVLNENERGSSVGKLKPSSTHANDSLSVKDSPSTTCSTTTPSASLRAVSSESASRA